MHNSIFPRFYCAQFYFFNEYFTYFRFAKELELYQNDNYVGSNENVLVYIMNAAHKPIEISEETRRSSYMSHCMRFPTMWCVRPAKPQISLRIRTV